MDPVALRKELADFLRTKRKELPPAAVGLRAGARRHTMGLRREEVAQLAGISLTWYTWLEQGRDIRVSRPVLTSIAQALRLDPLERMHFYTLADAALYGHRTTLHCPDCGTALDVAKLLRQLEG